MKASGPIVAAVDFSGGSLAVVSHAIALAVALKQSLVLIHVIDSKVLRHHSAAVGRDLETSGLISQAQTRLAAMVTGAADGTHITSEVKCGRPLDEIHELVENSHASLLVMGANDLTRKHLGSVASNCLRTVPCDVLILRDWQAVTFRKILVCTDLTPLSRRALEQGAAFALLHRAKLDVAYVMYPPTLDIWGELQESESESELEDGETYEQRCRKAVAGELDAFVKNCVPDLSRLEHCSSILNAASPGLALTYHARDTDTDLAVVGSRLHSRLANLFSASTAEHLLHDTAVSLLAVRDHS
jgi:nucleotide-binding universal stress UspA family protein